MVFGEDEDEEEEEKEDDDISLNNFLPLVLGCLVGQPGIWTPKPFCV